MPRPRARLAINLVQLLLVLGVTAYLLWYAGPSRLAKELLSANGYLLLLAFLAFVLVAVLKAWRFASLLRPKPPLSKLFRITLFQDVLNTILPARAGEVSYIAMLKVEGTCMGEGIASLVLARVGDLSAATLLFYLSIAVLRDLPRGSVLIWLPAAVLVLGLSSAVVIAAVLRDRFPSLASRLASLFHLPQRAREYCFHRATELIEGLKIARNPRILAACLLFSIGIWLSSALVFYLWLLALGSPLSYWQCVFLQAVLALVALLHVVLGPAVAEGSLFGLLVLLGIGKETAVTLVLATAVILALYYAVLMPIAFLISLAPSRKATGDTHPSSGSPSRSRR